MERVPETNIRQPAPGLARDANEKRQVIKIDAESSFPVVDAGIQICDFKANIFQQLRKYSV